MRTVVHLRMLRSMSVWSVINLEMRIHFLIKINCSPLCIATPANLPGAALTSAISILNSCTYVANMHVQYVMYMYMNVNL